VSDQVLEGVFGKLTSPYLIWSPRWVESSAGIRAIHLLCHALNTAGFKAYLVFFDSPLKSSPSTNPELITPVISREQLADFNNSGVKPIAVYPEDVIGNPLSAPVVIRFLWNYSGALGGPQEFAKSESVWAFSENIALDYESKSGVKPKVLFVPPVNPRDYEPCELKKPFQIVYAGKYRSFVGEPFKVGSLPTIEIFRSGPKKQNRNEVKRLLAEANVLFSFENSSIVTEAILSGTPAGFIPNPFLGRIIAEHELGWAGSFIGDAHEDIEKARSTLKAGKDSYLKSIEVFSSNLLVFAAESQEFARRSTSNLLTRIPNKRSMFTQNRLWLSFEIIRSKGFKVFFKELIRFLKSRV
jgi:hypothetical protein